jgi:acetyl-CoA carboxylase carboxyltransferase component
MHFGVVRFPGSNCDEDALHVVQRVLAPKGATGRLLWHKDTELGGGRGSDSDAVGGGETDTFYRFAALSGGAPLVGIASGRCFAGNAVLLGCCDVIIATRNANIGMAGPAMIEGGGLGVYRPEDIGPMSVFELLSPKKRS